jgi:hypothetical protein
MKFFIRLSLAMFIFNHAYKHPMIDFSWPWQVRGGLIQGCHDIVLKIACQAPPREQVHGVPDSIHRGQATRGGQSGSKSIIPKHTPRQRFGKGLISCGGVFSVRAGGNQGNG